MSGQEISPMRQKIKAITNLAPARNITKVQHMIGLIGYYRKFFPVFSYMIRHLNELTRKNIPFKWMEKMLEKLGLHQASYHHDPHFSLPRPR